MSWSYNPGRASTRPVWANPLSLATTRGITVVFFSCGYLDVSVPHVRLPIRGYQSETGGLPHSETRGSRAICASPRLIAAYRVLRRLREPRHPPSALSHFLASPTGFPGRRHICLVTRMISLPCSQHVNALSPVFTGYVENNGFEPLTLCLQSRCSSQLS